MALVDYAWRGLWRPSFASSPWAGVASAGSSSGEDLLEATNPPSTGTAQNGKTPARFDGVNDILSTESIDSVYIDSTAFTVHAVVKVLSTSAPQTYYWDEPCLLVQPSSAGIAIGISSSGVGLEVYDSGGAQQTARVALHGGYNVIQAKYDGTNAKIRANGGAWQSVAADSVYISGGALQLGTDYTGSVFLHAEVFELAITDVALSDSALDDCRNDSELSLGTALSGTAGIAFSCPAFELVGASDISPNAAGLTFGGTATLISDALEPSASGATFDGVAFALEANADLTLSSAGVAFTCASFELASDAVFPGAAGATFGGTASLEATGDLAPSAAALTFTCSPFVLASSDITPGVAGVSFGGTCRLYASGSAAYALTLPRRSTVEASGLDRLIDEYRNAPDRFPVLYGLLRAYLRAAQRTEDATFAVLASRYPSQLSGYGPALNARLDVLGALVGELRKGRDDTAYALGIKVRVRINTSDGLRVDLFEIVRLIADEPFIYSEGDGLCFHFDMSDLTDAEIEAIATALVEAKPAGYRAHFTYSNDGASVLRFGYGASAPSNGTVLGYGANENGTFAGSKAG